MALIIAWFAVGAICILLAILFGRRKLTVFDLLIAAPIGAVFGFLIPIGWILYVVFQYLGDSGLLNKRIFELKD